MSRRRRGSRGGCSESASRPSRRSSAPGTARSTTSPGCGCSTRRSCGVHPTGKAILKLGVKSQGQGHETTFGQIVAQELGIPTEDIEVQEGDTDHTPYGLGTYASRSTPVAGAATTVVARKLRDKGRGDRRAPARSVGRRHRVRGRPLLRQGLPRAGEDDPGRRLRGVHGPPRRHGSRTRGRHVLRPAEHDLPVRRTRSWSRSIAAPASGSR